MKRLKKTYEKLPRPLRTAIHLGLLPLLALVIYIVIQTPTFSGTIALRLAEKANMVGPGRILGTVTHYAHTNTEVIVAEDDHGYIFCRYYKDSPYNYPLLSYREKQGELTLLACPFYLLGREDDRLPVLLMCDDPKAEFAVVDISITFPWDGSVQTYEYSLREYRMTEGYFQFHIDVVPYKGTEAEYRALDTFSRVSQTNYGTPYYGSDIHATVKLYKNCITNHPDGSTTLGGGELYKTAELTIDSVADDAVARFGNP